MINPLKSLAENFEINDSLRNSLKNKLVEENLCEANDSSNVFEEIARSILSGHFLVQKNNSNSFVEVYPTCIEIYCHEEQNDGVKDYIVYHRNTKSCEKSVFPLGVLHNHQSGIDITFEKDRGEKLKQLRLSALVREFQIRDSRKNNEKYEHFDNYKRKNEYRNYDVISGPIALYDALYSSFSIFDGGFSVKWIDGIMIDNDKIETSERVNVALFKKKDGKEEKAIWKECKKCDKRKKDSDKYCPDMRKWQFRIKNEFLPLKKLK